MIFVWGGIGILFFITLYIYNILVFKRNEVANGWADIDVQLKKRYDLIPNIVETVKGYKDFESKLLEDITKKRTAAMKGGTLCQKSENEDKLSSTLKNLFAVAENYPDLKSSNNFLNLQYQLSEVEDTLQMARRYYNAAVREFNIACEKFPFNIIANLFYFQKATFFKASSEESQNVNISFDSK